MSATMRLESRYNNICFIFARILFSFIFLQKRSPDTRRGLEIQFDCERNYHVGQGEEKLL